jgi:hypothetical protein
MAASNCSHVPLEEEAANVGQDCKMMKTEKRVTKNSLADNERTPAPFACRLHNARRRSKG